LAERHGTLGRDLGGILVPADHRRLCQTHHPLAFLNIDLVTNNDLFN
jgi:hypothetical protein